ncbi:MAG: Hpt domain-containing protein [Lachnospiraceae bacterium]|nr:Hpt domain-containing protein [Lachnospiraceae bacterium]
MITIDNLAELGADVEDGVARCMGKEDFYLKLVNMVVADDGYERLKAALEAHDLDEAFERAHALKGTIANVSLTPLLEPISAMTEQLRNRNDIDYSDLLDKMFEELDKLRAL